jgi:hypothetical protein
MEEREDRREKLEYRIEKIELSGERCPDESGVSGE